MSTIRRILVAVADPASRAQPAIAKAAQLARRTGAEVDVFHCLFNPYVQAERVYGGRGREKDIEALVEATRSRLAQRAASFATKGLRLRVSVRWDYPAHEGIVRQALRQKSDLVVAESHRHRKVARMLLANTDWQLIRVCPVPLLLVKTTRPWTSAKVLAAIDPLHLHAKPTALDPRILKVAALLARALGSQLHVAHAHAPLLDYSPGMLTDPLPYRVTGHEGREYAKRLRKSVLAETRRFSVNERRVHVLEGEPARVLPRLARRLGAQMLVMGAVSRSGLTRLFIGSTAERVIDELPCDVCIVKAPGFRTPVSTRQSHLPVMVPPL
jgi:universal stress protein E